MQTAASNLNIDATLISGNKDCEHENHYVKHNMDLTSQFIMMRTMRMNDYKLLEHYSKKGMKKKKIKKRISKASQRRNRK